MNKIRFSFFIAGAALALTASGLQAQTSIQRLTFSLTGQYQTNIFTNAANDASSLTNEYWRIRNILITTHSVIKAVAIDMDGTNWTNWATAFLVREVNLTNGNEGIFLYTSNNIQTNVSSYFGGSFSNNFTGDLTNAFPGVTNNISGLTNIVNGSTNNPAQFELNHGSVIMTDPTNSTTNFVTTSGLYFISLNTTNLKFNLVGVGSGTVTNVAGRVDGTLYERPINSQLLGTAGAFYLNTATNFFDMGTNAAVYFTGPLHGTFITTQPFFSTIPGP